MKHTLRAKALTWLLSFAMLALPVFASGSTVYADDSSESEPVTYMDWDEATGKLVEKTCTDYTVVDGLTIWQEGGMLDGRWYVVKGDVTFDASGPYDGRINIINSAKLILTDGCTLRANKGIKVCIDRSGDEVVNTLTIYGQKEGTGRLNAIATDSHAAIGGNGVRDDGTDFCDAGNVIINGGIIYAEGNVSAPGIGGGEHGKGGNVVINHGSLTAEGRAYSSGMIPAIGGGYKAEDEGTVSINKDLIAVAGNSKNDLTDVTDSFSQSHNQQYVYIGEPTNHTATFKVINGKWNDKTTGDKTYSFRTCNGVAVKIPAEGFPAAGNEPDMHYKRAGVWEPSQDTITSEDKTYTYYYSYEDDTPDIVIGADVLGDGRNTENAKTVMFGGKSWRVIGYKGHGVASERVNMTLLSSEILGHLHFGPEDNNSYADSELKTKIDEISGALTDGEKSAVPGRTLTSGTYTGYDTDCIAGAEVNDALMWPLSIKEANALNSTLRLSFHQDDTHWQRRTWWLRSPGSYSNDIAIVFNDGRVFEEGYPGQSQYFGVRPAFNVKLGAVLFSSAAGGKVSGAEGSDALKEVGKASGDTWKLTLKDNSRSGFTAQPKSVTDDTMTIKYAGAATGDNEYVSAIITGSENRIKYYGRIKKCSSSADASGTVMINTADKIGKDDTLYVFNEQFNGDNKTDYASVPIRCAMKYTWADDNSSVTAMCTLPDGSEVTETVKTTSKVTTAPYCEREGEATYTAKFTKSAFETQTKTASMPSYGHSWGAVKYEWSADNSSVTAKRVCSRDPRSHIEAETVGTTSKKTRDPACEEKGEIVYTAAFHKEAFGTQTKAVETDALGHELEEWVRLNDKEPLCDRIGGYDLSKKCSRCGEEIVRVHVVIPSKGHQWSEWSGTEATETEDGERTRTCSVCNKTEKEIIPAKGHTHNLKKVAEVPATCSEDGKKAHWECTGCGNLFADKTGETPVTSDELVIKASGEHTKGEVKKEDVTEPTCTKAGKYTEITYCSECSEEIGRETVRIDELGHEPGETVEENRVYATYDSAGGYDLVSKCKRCSAVISNTHIDIPKLEKDEYNIDIKTNVTDDEDAQGGTVTGGEDKGKKGRIYRLEPIPKSGYVFLYWLIGGETRINDPYYDLLVNDADEAETVTVEAVFAKSDVKYGGSRYKLYSKGTAALTKAKSAKSITVPATLNIDGKKFKVTQIKAKALKGSKATKLTVKTKYLTKKSVKGSLKGSKIRTVKVSVGKKSVNKKYVKKYKKIFTKRNAGRKVSVK